MSWFSHFITASLHCRPPNLKSLVIDLPCCELAELQEVARLLESRSACIKIRELLAEFDADTDYIEDDLEEFEDIVRKVVTMPGIEWQVRWLPICVGILLVSV